VKEFISFREYYSNTNSDDISNIKPGMMDGVYDIPAITFNVQNKNVSGRVVSISFNTNPIKLVLSDGTVWKLSKAQWDYLVKIGKEPKKGKLMSMEITPDATVKNVEIEN
jgi:hypothetical protein